MFENQKALKAVIKKHLSASLNPKPRPKKTRYSLEQEKARVLEMVGNTVHETIKKVDLNRIIVEKIESIDWKEKIRETVSLALKRTRGIVE